MPARSSGSLGSVIVDHGHVGTDGKQRVTTYQVRVLLRSDDLDSIKCEFSKAKELPIEELDEPQIEFARLHTPQGIVPVGRTITPVDHNRRFGRDLKTDERQC